MGQIFIVSGAISNLMTSWKVCTNEEYESLRKSRPCWKCTTWRFIRRKTKLDHHRLKTIVKRRIKHNLRSRNFEAKSGRIESNILVNNQREQRRVHKGQRECWQWQANGQCSKGDKCSFRHDGNKRAKATTPPAPAPEPSTQPQDVKNSAKSKSPRGRSPSGRISRLPCKHHLKGT